MLPPEKKHVMFLSLNFFRFLFMEFLIKFILTIDNKAGLCGFSGQIKHLH